MIAITVGSGPSGHPQFTSHDVAVILNQGINLVFGLHALRSGEVWPVPTVRTVLKITDPESELTAMASRWSESLSAWCHPQ